MDCTRASLAGVDRLALELKLTPRCDREDASQEAWVALLEGRNPARAVSTYAQRERRHRLRQRTNRRHWEDN